MGWASGSELAEEIWHTVKKAVPKEKRQKVARKIVELFENQDCDTLQEAESLVEAAGERWFYVHDGGMSQEEYEDMLAERKEWE